MKRTVEGRVVDVFELARTGGRVEGELEAADLGRLAALLTAPMGRIRFGVQGRIDEQGRNAATLRIEGLLGLRCDLCGGRLEWTLAESDGFFFVDDEAHLSGLPITVEGDEPLLASRQFDLQDLVEDQAILALPISPRHPACDQPGQGRGEPDKAEQGTTRPFAVLASLKRGRSDIQ
jgi:uncharacterized protein